jgi:DNA invertase Pin-like site-specific DNA recombinase
MKIMTKAYSYVRFSSKAQADGASLNRQLKSAREYAAQHNLELDDSSYQDLGVSAYKGLNAIDGKLGAFLQAVEEGRIQRGSYLLVESLDRISRNVITEAQALFMRIINSDITIVTLLDGQIFSKKQINEDGGISIIISLLYMLRAHEEQKTKAQRVRDGWEEARQTKKIITSLIPSWLKIVDNEFEIIPEKAEIIKLIFKYGMEGKGSLSIARILNNDNIPVLGPSKQWTPGTVGGQLRNVACIGSYETPKISLRENYYPAIIDKEVFYTIKQMMKTRNKAPGMGFRTDSIANLFSGRSYCGICGCRMKVSLRAKLKGSTSPNSARHYLICNEAYGQKTCTGAKRVPYDQFETQLLWVLIGMQHRNVFDLKQEVQYDPRPALQEEIKAKEQTIEKHLDNIEKMPNSPSLLKRLATLEQEVEELKKKLSETVPVKTTNEGLENVLDVYHRFKELKKTPESKEYKDLREELQVGLRRVVAKIDFHHKPAEGKIHHFRITFVSGTCREWWYEAEPMER